MTDSRDVPGRDCHRDRADPNGIVTDIRNRFDEEDVL